MAVPSGMGRGRCYSGSASAGTSPPSASAIAANSPSSAWAPYRAGNGRRRRSTPGFGAALVRSRSRSATLFPPHWCVSSGDRFYEGWGGRAPGLRGVRLSCGPFSFGPSVVGAGPRSRTCGSEEPERRNGARSNDRTPLAFPHRQGFPIPPDPSPEAPDARYDSAGCRTVARLDDLFALVAKRPVSRRVRRTGTPLPRGLRRRRGPRGPR